MVVVGWGPGGGGWVIEGPCSLAKRMMDVASSGVSERVSRYGGPGRAVEQGDFTSTSPPVQ